MKRRSFIQSCIGAAASLKTREISSRIRGSFIRGKYPFQEDKDVLVKVIGTAQDGGIPHMGCFCPHCRRAWEESRYRRLISSLALIDLIENKAFIVDATPDIRAQTKMIRDRISSGNKNRKFLPDGILLTHAHIGHYTGLIFYGYEAQSAHRLPVYCSERMEIFLAQNGPWNQLVEQENIVTGIIKLDAPLPLTSRLSVSAFQVPHREEYTDTLGFKIMGPRKSLLYIPDIQNWKAWDRSITEEVQTVDIALLDGTFYSPEELPSRDLSAIGHPFITDSMELLRKFGQSSKSQIYFTHLNHSNLALDPEGTARKSIEGKGFHLAEEGMEFLL
jgi:pyrroloquinoline quinone biosynthesis protein B